MADIAPATDRASAEAVALSSALADAGPANKSTTQQLRAVRPNSPKQIQATPNKTKQNSLVLFGFIRQNRDFSMGYSESK
jgi:hypothetical protein